MGLEFRWQVESEDEWEAYESPPKRQRPFPWRAVGVLALLLAVGVGIAAGVFWHRVRQGEARLRHELRAVANLEAQALRDGDRETFLSLQDRGDTRWYGRQEDRFPPWDGFADLEPGQGANLAVLEAALMPENRAWAEVAWALEDGLYRRAQFYRQETGSWLRTGARCEYFGPERTRQTAHFAFTYRSCDEPTVGWMAEQLEVWHEAVCADLGCDDERRINVLIKTLNERVGEHRPPQGFILSSPRLRGVREDGALLPREREQLAQILVYLLASRRAGDIELENQPYLLPQLVNWEMRRLGLAGEDTPPTPVLDAVMASHGIEGVRDLQRAMSQTTSEDEALRLALGLGLKDLDVVFGQYLAALLALERQMMEWQTVGLVAPTSQPLARRTFDALLAEKVGRWRSEKDSAFTSWRNSPGMYFYPKGSLSYPMVERWELLDDAMLWAEVSYSKANKVEFFEALNGAWRHTSPYGRFLGEETSLYSEHFCLICHEREVDMMVGELAHLESLYRRIADALQVELPPGERLTIQITTPATWGSVNHDTVYVQQVSPYLVGWNDEPDTSYLASAASYRLFERLARQSAEFARPTGSREMWWEMMLDIWQWLIVDPEPANWDMMFREMEPFILAVRSGELISLSELGQLTFSSEPLPDGEVPFPEGWTEDEAMLLYMEVVTVVGYAGETYGLQAYPKLLRSLSEADSLEEWLQSALDVAPETFEANWQAWLEEQIGQ